MDISGPDEPNTESKPSRHNKNDVFLILRKAISEGEFQPGQRLPAERDLASRLNVARGTLREGLRDLERAALVERRQGSGTYVTYASETHLPTIIENVRPLELVDARLALEPHMCRKAVLHATDDDFARVEHVLRGMDDCVEDPTRFSKLDEEFHLLLAELSGNRLMQWMAQSMSVARTHSQWSRVRTITLNPDIIKVYNEQHRGIVQAIKTRDPEAAATAMRQHIFTARESLQNIAEV